MDVLMCMCLESIWCHTKKEGEVKSTMEHWSDNVQQEI